MICNGKFKYNGIYILCERKGSCSSYLIKAKKRESPKSKLNPCEHYENAFAALQEEES